MVFANSDSASADIDAVHVVKLLVASGFGVDKTKLVTAVSEIAPLRAEERLSELGAAVDD
jgi:hypothetical protein